MGIFLKILLSGLLLLLLLAVGAEVVALHRGNSPNVSQTIPAVVVRKAARALTPPKSVHPVSETELRLVEHSPHPLTPSPAERGN